MPTRVRSVARAVHILVFVAAGGNGRSSAEVAAELGIPLPTAYHQLNTLVDEGALAKHEGRFYLGPTIGLLADAYFNENSEPPHMIVPLRELARATRETVYLSAWRHGEVRILASFEGDNALRVVGLARGLYGAAHARASGKLLLALLSQEASDAYLAAHELESLTPNTIVDIDAFKKELAHIREAGHAVDREEFTAGVSCIAAPIWQRGVAAAAVTLCAPTQRFEENREWYLESVLAAAYAGSLEEHWLPSVDRVASAVHEAASA